MSLYYNYDIMSFQYIEGIMKEYYLLDEKNKNKSLEIEEKSRYDNLEKILTTYKFIIKDEKISSKCQSDIDIDNYNYNQIIDRYEILNKKIIFEQKKQNMTEQWNEYNKEHLEDYNKEHLEDYNESTNKLFEK